MCKLNNIAQEAKKNVTNKPSSETIENMRVPGAARYLACGITQVWEYAKRGDITPIRLSAGHTIFRKSDLDRFINSKAEVD